MSACLSVHNLKSTRPNFMIFARVACGGRGWFSADGVAIRYVLPVLWMTSCFHIMRPVGENQARRYV